MNQRYQQLDPVRSNPPLADADALAHRTSNGVDPKTIEALKVARNQVIQAEKGRGENTNVNKEPNPSPKQAPHNKFAEEFVQKFASIERETAAIDEEMANVEKLWSSLVEKKKKLEDRRNELIKVKDKLQELDKEMSNVLKSQKI